MDNCKQLIAAAILLCGVSAASAADNDLLLTKDEAMFGFSVSQYNYREPNLVDWKTGNTLDVKISGPLFGVHGEKTWSLADGDFLRLDANFQDGRLDYSGSGNQSHEPNRILDVRFVYGDDAQLANGVLSSYIGIGYRSLYDDGRGITSTGKFGYQREQQYTYLPIGLRYKTLWNNKKLSWNAEAGILISGSNFTHLSDYDPSLPNMTFKQKNGYELRLAAMLTQGAWDVGPYLQYWKVGDSEIVNFGTFGFQEPKNTTVDVGVKVDRRF
jgi:hypothetical protein